jgi:hypothetical protein
MAAVVCVMESKLDVVNQFVINECFGARFDGYVYLPAVGTAGGIIVTWQSPDVQVLGMRVDRFSVLILLSIRDGSSWWLTAVYGPTLEALKPAFLDELRMLHAAIAGPWAVTGDFNLILDACDKSNSRLNRRSMAHFRRCVNDLELKESALIGRRFTWSNERETPTLVKLDRWFGSVEWDDLHPDASLAARSSSLSDHCPILMSTSVQFFSKRRFHFERVWLRKPPPLRVMLCNALTVSYAGLLECSKAGVRGRSVPSGTSCALPTRLFFCLTKPKMIVLSLRMRHGCGERLKAGSWGSPPSTALSLGSGLESLASRKGTPMPNSTVSLPRLGVAGITSPA